MIQYSPDYHYVFDPAPESAGPDLILSATDSGMEIKIRTAVHVRERPRGLPECCLLENFIQACNIPGRDILFCIYTRDSYGIENICYLDGCKKPLRRTPEYDGIARLMQSAGSAGKCRSPD